MDNRHHSRRHSASSGPGTLQARLCLCAPGSCPCAARPTANSIGSNILRIPPTSSCMHEVGLTQSSRSPILSANLKGYSRSNKINRRQIKGTHMWKGLTQRSCFTFPSRVRTRGSCALAEHIVKVALVWKCCTLSQHTSLPYSTFLPRRISLLV